MRRILSLVDQPSRSWIEEKLVGQMMERPRRLMWVRGHTGSGIEGNEALDRRAKMEVQMGKRMHLPDIATAAGIRQAFPLHPKAPAHLSRDTGFFLLFFLKVIINRIPPIQTMAMDRIPRVETRQRTLSTTGPIPPLKPPQEEKRTRLQKKIRTGVKHRQLTLTIKSRRYHRTKTLHLRASDARRGLTYLVTDKGCSGKKWAKWMIRAAYVMMGGHRKMRRIYIDARG